MKNHIDVSRQLAKDDERGVSIFFFFLAIDVFFFLSKCHYKKNYYKYEHKPSKLIMKKYVNEVLMVKK